MGGCGWGKRTLLNVVSWIEEICRGRVIGKGEEVNKVNEKALGKLGKEWLGLMLED